MTVNDIKVGAFCRSIALSFIFFAVVWWCALPRVRIYFPSSARGTLSYTLNVQHTIVRGEIKPGQITGGSGHVFPSDKFFMQFEWTTAGVNRCLNIAPQWPYTYIYLNAAGAIDKTPESGTHLDRIERC
jgi:hypothetical protein